MNTELIAVVILPPARIRAMIDPLRSVNDKSHPRWSAHITILPPFLRARSDLPNIAAALDQAVETLQYKPFKISLDQVSHFVTRDYNTVYLTSQTAIPQLQAFYDTSVHATDHPCRRQNRPFTPHLTLGQTARTSVALNALQRKGQKIATKGESWTVENIVILRRNPLKSGVMEFYHKASLVRRRDSRHEDVRVALPSSFCYRNSMWITAEPQICKHTQIRVATYNILSDPSIPFLDRLPVICAAIIESGADVISLQEVTDEAINFILADEGVRASFTWSSHAPGTIFPSERNTVLLARYDYGFRWSTVQLGTKYRTALVAIISTPRNQVAIAGVHLVAGMDSQAMTKKTAQLKALTDYLHSEGYLQFIIAGDLNWPDNQRIPEDLGLIDMYQGIEGQSYDPVANILASQITFTKQNRSPQRYDRVLVNCNCDIDMTGAGSLFGVNLANPPSDHWGFAISLSLVKDLRSHHSTQIMAITPERYGLGCLDRPATLLETLTDDELTAFCSRRGYIPSREWYEIFEFSVNSVLAFVKTTFPLLTPNAAESHENSSGLFSPAVRVIAQPVGSYRLGCHTQHSDIDVLCVGNISRDTFFNIVRFKLRDTHNGPVKLRRFVRDATVPMLELEIHDSTSVNCKYMKVDLQYAQVGNLVNHWLSMPELPKESPLLLLPAPSLRMLNAYRDAVSMMHRLPSMVVFRLAYRVLKYYLLENGLFGARFGYIGGVQLQIMLTHVCMRNLVTASAGEVVSAFFCTFASGRWDFARAMVAAYDDDPKYRRSSRECMVVLSIESPRVNTAARIHPHAIQRTQDAFSVGARRWPQELLCYETEPPFLQFLTRHTHFIKIDIRFWGSNCMTGRAFVGWMESRLTHLLLRLSSEAPTVAAHLWPHCLADHETNDVECLNGFYLVSLSFNLPPKSAAEQAQIFKITKQFDSYLHQNRSYYEPANTIIACNIIHSSQMPALPIKLKYKWADNGIDDLGSESDQDSNDRGVTPTVTDYTAIDKSETRVKLRTSLDVMNRIIHDQSINIHDYMVGYEDRFEGVKEMPVASWKRETDDLAFIPLHRVTYFRRKADNIVVWDKRLKKDLIFRHS